MAIKQLVRPLKIAGVTKQFNQVCAPIDVGRVGPHRVVHGGDCFVELIFLQERLDVDAHALSFGSL